MNVNNREHLLCFNNTYMQFNALLSKMSFPGINICIPGKNI